MQEGPLFKSQLSYVADLATAIGSVSNSEFRGLCKSFIAEELEEICGCLKLLLTKSL